MLWQWKHFKLFKLFTSISCQLSQHEHVGLSTNCTCTSIVVLQGYNSLWIISKSLSHSRSSAIEGWVEVPSHTTVMGRKPDRVSVVKCLQTFGKLTQSTTVEPLLMDTSCRRTPPVSGHKFEHGPSHIQTQHICGLRGQLLINFLDSEFGAMEIYYCFQSETVQAT